MLLFNYFSVHDGWDLLYGGGLWMLFGEKLKSKGNLSPARANLLGLSLAKNQCQLYQFKIIPAFSVEVKTESLNMFLK